MTAPRKPQRPLNHLLPAGGLPQVPPGSPASYWRCGVSTEWAVYASLKLVPEIRIVSVKRKNVYNVVSVPDLGEDCPFPTCVHTADPGV